MEGSTGSLGGWSQCKANGNLPANEKSVKIKHKKGKSYWHHWLFITGQLETGVPDDQAAGLGPAAWTRHAGVRGALDSGPGGLEGG